MLLSLLLCKTNVNSDITGKFAVTVAGAGKIAATYAFIV